MEAAELKQQVETLRDALHRSEQHAMGRIFALYREVTGKNERNRGCYNCAIECLVELATIAKSGKSISLNRKQTNHVMPKLTKYKIPKPFRPFGDPKVFNEMNTTDEELEQLIAIQPRMAAHVTMLDGSPFTMGMAEMVSTETEPEESEPTEPVEAPKPKRKNSKQ